MADVKTYSNSDLAQYMDLMKPMATPDKTAFLQNESNPSVLFTCNIPGYSMTVTSMPQLETAICGEHLAAIEADFKGATDFSAKFAFRYTVTEDAGVSEVTMSGSTVDIFTVDGILLYDNVDGSRVSALPAGLYIIKSGNGNVKKIVR